MSNVYEISYESKTYTLSLIKWGVLRRLLAKVFNASDYIFSPSWELAIYDKEDIYSRQYDNPLFVFHFKEKIHAVRKLNLAKELINEGGIDAFIDGLSINAEEEGIFCDMTNYFERN